METDYKCAFCPRNERRNVCICHFRICIYYDWKRNGTRNVWIGEFRNRLYWVLFCITLDKKAASKKAILLGGILLYLAILLLVFNLTYTKLLIYASIIAIAYPMLLVPYVSMTYDVIGKGWNAAEMRIEYIVVREIFLNSGRIVSILIFLLAVSFFDPKQSIPILLLLIGSGHSLIYFFVRKIEFH